MSIEDEIRAKKEQMQKEIRDAEIKKQNEDIMKKALENARMGTGTPELILPPVELQNIISEVLSSLSFTNRKVIRNMPNGKTLIREADNGERADDYSYDCCILSKTIDKTSHLAYLWILKNGAIAFSKDSYHSNTTWDELKRSYQFTPNLLREKIIESLASQAINKESPKQINNTSANSTQSKNKTSGGCYVATCVYGNYDCPQVWVLRRYRDYYLKERTLGRIFIKLYYAISPNLVRLFGDKVWFKSPIKKVLDKKIINLKEKGYSDKKYED